MIPFVQLCSLAFISRIPNHHHSVGRCLSALFFFATSSRKCWFYFSLNIGMLIMRMYALYDRSRKVLAFYIVIAAVVVAVGCVSLNLSTQSDMPLLISWHIVGNSESKTRWNSGQANVHRLRFKFESRRVSTINIGSKFTKPNSLITPSFRAIRESI